MLFMGLLALACALLTVWVAAALLDSDSAALKLLGLVLVLVSIKIASSVWL